jgi:hypothetical protein
MKHNLNQSIDSGMISRQRERVTAQVKFVQHLLGEKNTKAAAPRAASGPSSKPPLPKKSTSPAQQKKEAAPFKQQQQQLNFSNLIDDRIEARVAEMERRLVGQLGRLEDRVKVLESEAAERRTVETNLESAIAALQADVEKKDQRNIALLKKLHGIHSQELVDKTATLRTDHDNALENLHSDLRVQSKEVIRLRTALDALATRESSAQKDESSVTATLLDELSLRVGKLETRQFLSQNSSAERAVGGGGGGTGEATSPAGRGSSREDKLVYAALKENMTELALQLNDVESELNTVTSAVKSMAASMQTERQKRQALGLGDREEEMASMQKKIQGVGKHASKAIQGLNESLQDIQQSILALYSWSNSVNAKLYLPLVDSSSWSKVHKQEVFRQLGAKDKGVGEEQWFEVT